ncbi:predicted protein [Chaetomium globosum CBS 148.51]|uniref:Endonuclease/exonuclease/phosphatase domain-containing protein n=1 Tax=Chaetomium globosum (strain ATCC 6205 / CBS 148.51 / DSM 1962 / NBRC 6347 / NRRL 1970) TaxID=306901 RepID=Q2GUK9_CHAGB|nr:uncharacterized protein CHGG_08345 [Chaetomium globosum CBS 148.51]EAQ84331.1 predicted protein [Chaetomium globosum CBS 148.51]
MAGSAQDQIVVEVADQPSPLKRPSRAPKPSAKVREAMQSIEDATTASRRTTSDATRTIASRGTRALGGGNATNSEVGTGKTALQTLLEVLNAQRNEMLARASYAEVARTPPSSQPSGVRTLSSSNTTPSSFTDTMFCAIDTSRAEENEKNKVQVADVRKAIEAEVRTLENMGDWRCAAVVKEARNPDRVKVVCRDENETRIVKDAAQKITVPGVRVLRDQLYPVRIDNANRTAVLDADGNVLPGAMEALGAENDVNIAKIAWLSRKDTGKAYGLMVVYPENPPTRPCSRPGRAQPNATDAKRWATRPSHARSRSCTMGPRTLEILQLNVRKRREVQESLLNDEGLKNYTTLAISEPYARLIDGSVAMMPMSHHNWTKLIPTTRRETRWPIRSMLWVRSDVEAEQIPVPSADLTAAQIRLPDRVVLVVSVYVEGGSDETLEVAMRELDRLIRRFRNGTGNRTDIILAGDFNRHDQLWGGDDVSPLRQVEDRQTETRFLFKDAPWAEIRNRVAANLEHTPQGGSVQQQTDRLMTAVTEAVFGLTHKAKPSPYAKRWWTTDLTRLRQAYTFWRNQARARRRMRQTSPELEQRARNAAKEYHDAIRRQKSSHWNDFLADDANIWQATKYLQTGSGTMGDKVPPLTRPDGSVTEGKEEQAQTVGAGNRAGSRKTKSPF